MASIPKPVEAQKFLKHKTIVETEDWDDLQWGEHSHAFTVAHSIGAGVLNDIFGMLNEAMASGQSFQSFKKELRGLMADKGWHGREDKDATDKEYINWRIKMIFHTNMQTAYSAGQYRQQLRIADMRPIWKYCSQLAGDNRRPDHIALHGKAFRHDDPFWNAHYPPNGWGCQCYVTSLSETEAKDEKTDILKSDDEGNPPALTDRNFNPVDWKTFAPKEWKYNPGREALAPNFASYKNLAKHKMPDRKSALHHVTENYRKNMDETKLTQGEFDALLKRMAAKEYRPGKRSDDEEYINYQVGNIAQPQHEVMVLANVNDSKIMATDKELTHSIAVADKGVAPRGKEVKIPKEYQKDIYPLLQNPERIYEDMNKQPGQGRIFHFVKSTPDGKAIHIVLEQANETTALRIVTSGHYADEYDNQPKRYKKIW